MDKDKSNSVLDLAERFQDECHNFVENFESRTRRNLSIAEYQDATNVYFFQKLALLQLEINELKSQS